MGSPVYAYEKLWPFIPFILVIIVTLLILNERGEKPNLEGKKIPKLSKLKIALIKSDEEKTDYEELKSIKGAAKHPGESVKVKGKITKKANNREVFIEDDTGEILLSKGNFSKMDIGDEFVAEGTVEGKVTWNAHLKQKLYAILLFLLAGFFGLIVLGAPGLTTYNWYPIPALAVSASTALLFPLFTGLFGLSTLLLSLIDTPTIPEQKIKDVHVNLKWWRKMRGVLSGTFAGGLVGWYPGVTSAQAEVTNINFAVISGI
jgi:TctA family transporter